MTNSRIPLVAAGLAVLMFGVLGVWQSSVAMAGDEKAPCTQPCKDTAGCKACCKDDCKACCKDSCAACCKDKGKSCAAESMSCGACKPKEGATPTEAKSAFANTKCPMMGSKIDASKVTPALTREFKGQKVAFCCGGCPAAWDKLTDAQKQAKLDAAK
ncbi:MAG: hypothetical protein LLG01_11485 [Planctomycetaceae bacterium]|nr:hypothetical protein [Planctomycetaceae bacterium]